MTVRRSTFFLGIFIFLIPFLGLPTFWKTFFIIFSGVTLVLLSIRINFLKLISDNRVKNSVISVEPIKDVVQNNPEIYRSHIDQQTILTKKTIRRKSDVSKNSGNKIV